MPQASRCPATAHRRKSQKWEPQRLRCQRESETEVMRQSRSFASTPWLLDDASDGTPGNGENHAPPDARPARRKKSTKPSLSGSSRAEITRPAIESTAPAQNQPMLRTKTEPSNSRLRAFSRDLFIMPISAWLEFSSSVVPDGVVLKSAFSADVRAVPLPGQLGDFEITVIVGNFQSALDREPYQCGGKGLLIITLLPDESGTGGAKGLRRPKSGTITPDWWIAAHFRPGKIEKQRNAQKRCRKAHEARIVTQEPRYFSAPGWAPQRCPSARPRPRSCPRPGQNSAWQRRGTHCPWH